MPTLIAMRSILQKLAYLLHDIIGSEAEMGHDVRALAGGAEAVDPHHASCDADVAPPALASAGLHGEPPCHCARQHRLTVRLVLLVEYLGRGHGDQTHAPPGLV